MQHGDEDGYPQQKVKVKLAAYPFAEYGMLDGVVSSSSTRPNGIC